MLIVYWDLGRSTHQSTQMTVGLCSMLWYSDIFFLTIDLIEHKTDWLSAGFANENVVNCVQPYYCMQCAWQKFDWRFPMNQEEVSEKFQRNLSALCTFQKLAIISPHDMSTYFELHLIKLYIIQLIWNLSIFFTDFHLNKSSVFIIKITHFFGSVFLSVPIAHLWTDNRYLQPADCPVSGVKYWMGCQKKLFFRYLRYVVYKKVLCTIYFPSN